MASESDPRPSPSKTKYGGLLSPGFRSVAATAGWDEESLLAGLVVEDTPERISKYKKRVVFPLRTPPTDSRRKRRSRRGSASIPAVVLDLDGDLGIGEKEEDKEVVGGGKEKVEEKSWKTVGNEKAVEKNGETVENEKVVEEDEKAKAIPCMDRLREELSCAICLEICFKPSTTPCGHSFCKKCLKRAASKCGKRCPKCRQLISNGRACTVNTVLWNTIQLLFPEELEARKGTTSRTPQSANPSPRTRSRNITTDVNTRNRSSFIMGSELVAEAEHIGSLRGGTRTSRNTRSTTTYLNQSENVLVTETERVRSLRGGTQTLRNLRNASNVNQSEDAALALRLQREEFMGSVMASTRRDVPLRRSSSLHTARANLRAIASRAIQSRTTTRFS